MKPLFKIDLEKRIFIDERGWVVNPIEVSSIASDTMGNLHAASIQPNAIRGNHSHPDCREWLFVFDGPALVSGKFKSGEYTETFQVEKDQPALFEIPPGAEHAIKNISDHIIYILSFSDIRDRTTEKCENLFD